MTREQRRGLIRFFLISPIIIITVLVLGWLFNTSEKHINDLNNNNISVRQNAIYNLGEAQESKAVPMLVQLLKTEDSKAVKLDILEALVEINASSSVAGLVEILDESDNEILISTIDALGKIGATDAVPALIKLLDREDSTIRLPAIRALGNFTGTKVVAALSRLIGDPDKYVRYNATQALKKIGASE